MRVTKGSVVLVNNNEVNIKISNGHREFMVEIAKENITLSDIENNDVSVKVYSMIRNCCASCPKYVLESGKNTADDEEIKVLLNDILKLIEEGKIEEKYIIKRIS